MHFNELVPELYVSDYKRSLHFYIEILGFQFEYGRSDPCFAYLSYYGSQLMLQQIEPTDDHTGILEYPYGRGINFQIETPDIAALVKSLKANKYPLRKEVGDYWRETDGGTVRGSREIQVLDPDGYYLRFSQALAAKKGIE